MAACAIETVPERLGLKPGERVGFLSKKGLVAGEAARRLHAA